jgi:hypothetical protein
LLLVRLIRPIEPTARAGRPRYFGCGSAALGNMRARTISLLAVLCLLLFGTFTTSAQGQVADPIFNPPSDSRLPVTVTISNATPDAAAYFTLDGTVPDTNSTLYTGPLSFTNYTVIRARAFKTGLTPSDTVFAGYYAWSDPPGVSYTRTVTNDLPDLPLVTVVIAGASNVACFAIEERLPAVIQATNITASGVWLGERGAVRWGPFTNTPEVTVSYRVTGMPGTYQVDGSASVDGEWTFGLSPSPVTVLTAGGSTNVPSMPPQVATPVFTPPSGANVPVDVTISCATTGAVIRYTLDGSLPDTASTLYTGAVHLAEAGMVRARAFEDGWTPSVASVAYYGPPLPPLDAQVTRTVSTNPPFAPVVSLSAAPGTNAVCFAVEEWLPPGLTASNVTASGVFSPTNRVVRWGPFFGTNTVDLSYQAVGPPGSYPVHATWSVDGVGGGETQATNVVVASGEGGVPVPPQPLPTPVLSPPSSTNLPVTVTITCADPLAEIRFTTDGSLPTEASALYTEVLNLTTATELRARAFRAGKSPSVAAYGRYEQLTTPPGVGFVRTITSNGTFLPLVTITATPQTGAQCFTITETLPSGLTPYELGSDAVWNETNRTLKWGPFLGSTPQAVSYKASGASASYELAGLGSVDGRPVAVTGDHTLVVDLTTMPQVATPVITPVPNGVFPVDITISCATTGAVIHYTLDGSRPTESSPVYTGPIHLDTITQIRVQAFLPWSVPSGSIGVLFGDEEPAAGTTIGRTIAGSGTASPLVQIAAQPGAAVRCYAVSDVLPAGLTPQQISGGGVFSAATGTIRWGPFLDAQARTLTYRLSGPDGTYELSGTGSFDGFGQVTPGDTFVVVDSHSYLARAVISNWSFVVSVVVTANPPAGASCYTVEEFLPAGITPTNISDGGLWNTNTLTIKWGPFLDDVQRALRYDPVGAPTNYQTSTRISVDGVSHFLSGDETVGVGLAPPTDLTAVPGSRVIYLDWVGTGHETGFKVYYWTLPNHSDEQALDIGAGMGGFYSLQGLNNGTNYFVAMTAYDGSHTESARSATVSATPNSAAGVIGVVSFDANYYGAVTNTAVVTVSDADMNTDPNQVETLQVIVTSDSDTNGFALTLTETGIDTGVFTSSATGTNLTFTFGPSDAGLKQLHVTEGDALRAIYNDTLPAGQRTAMAIFSQYDSNGNGIPDWWERMYFGGLGVVTATSDFDGDGVSDMDEYRAGTDPTDPNSVFKIVDLHVSPDGEAVLRWTSVAGKTYAIEKSTDLTLGFYELVSSLPATPPVNTYWDANPPDAQQVFYRVRCE